MSFSDAASDQTPLLDPRLGGRGKEKLQMEGLIGFGSHFIKTKCAHQRVGESLVKVQLQDFCNPKTLDRAFNIFVG